MSILSLAIGGLLIICVTLYAFPVEAGPDAAAVALQRAMLADRVGPRKDPILPDRKPAKDLGRDGLGAGEAQIRFHAAERIGREAHAFFDREPDLVLPVELVRGEGHQTEIERRGRIERRADMPVEPCNSYLIIKACLQSTSAVHHREMAEV